MRGVWEEQELATNPEDGMAIDRRDEEGDVGEEGEVIASKGSEMG